MGLVCQGWNIDRHARIENFIVTFDKPTCLSTDIEESMLRQTLRIKSDNQHRKDITSVDLLIYSIKHWSVTILYRGSEKPP